MSISKKKILIVVDWFYPGSKGGGPIKSSLNLALALKDDYDIEVLTTDTDHGDTLPYTGVESNVWTTHERLPGLKVFYAKKARLKLSVLRNEMKRSNADYIYLNHVWSPYFVLYPLWLKFRGKVRSKVILCPRGGLYDSAIAIKKFKKTPLLKVMDLINLHKGVVFHATNQREKEAIEKYFPGKDIIIADNLPSADQPTYAGLEKKLGILKCIFIARIVSIKNLLFLIEILKKVTSDVLLTIVGPIEEVDYWENCKIEIGKLPINITVEYLGSKKSDELIPILHEHHLFVLPTAGENFGHSIFESLLAGRPVLISDQTPWTGLSQKGIGWDLPLDDMDQFVTAIEVAANWDQAGFDEVSGTSWKFANQYLLNSKAISQYHELFK